MRLPIILLAAILFLGSCCHKTDCAFVSGVEIVFAGFSPVEIRAVKAISYRQNSNFSNAEDTLSMGNSGHVSDTTLILSPDADWMISVPANNRNYYITAYGFETRSCGNGCLLRKGSTYYALTGFSMNGNTYNAVTATIAKGE